MFLGNKLYPSVVSLPYKNKRPIFVDRNKPYIWGSFYENIPTITEKLTSSDKGRINELRTYCALLTPLKEKGIIEDFIANIPLNISIPKQKKYNTLQLDFIVLTSEGLIILEAKSRNIQTVYDSHLDDFDFQANRAAYLFGRFMTWEKKSQYLKHMIAGYSVLVNNLDLNTHSFKFVDTKLKDNNLNVTVENNLEKTLLKTRENIKLEIQDQYKILYSNTLILKENYDQSKRIFLNLKRRIDNMDQNILKQWEDRHIMTKGGYKTVEDLKVIRQNNLIGRGNVHNRPGLFLSHKFKT